MLYFDFFSFHLMPCFCLESHSGYHAAYSHHVHQVFDRPLLTATVTKKILSLMTLTVWRSSGQVLCRMPLNWNMSDAFPMITVGL